jgi:hypothetical protein
MQNLLVITTPTIKATIQLIAIAITFEGFESEFEDIVYSVNSVCDVLMTVFVVKLGYTLLVV